MIQFERISKRYKAKQVLNQITFTIKSGDLVAIIGERLRKDDIVKNGQPFDQALIRNDFH